MNTASSAPTDQVARSGGPASPMRKDRLPAWLRITKAAAGLTGLLIGAFAFFSRRPLWHTDIWGHLAYGREIWQTGLQVLWGHEPLMPLSEGVPFIDTAWLSQLLGYLSYQAFGVTALQFLFATALTAGLGLLAWRFFQRTGSGFITALGLAAFLFVAWQQLFVNSPGVLTPSAMIRPQLAGWLCFLAVFVLLTSRHWYKLNWVLIPLIFTLWANLHGSFLVGLTMLGCFCLGRAIDVERRSRRIGMIFKDRPAQRYFLLLELSAAAVLLNPYGLRIYAAVLEISGHPNMNALVEWDPLTLRMNQGVATAFAALVLMFLYRWSPRRISSIEVLLLMVFGGLTLYYSRFLMWLAPIAAYCMVLHGNAVLKKDRPQQVIKPAPSANAGWTVLCLVLLGTAWAYSPFGKKVLHNKDVEMSAAVSNLTPVRATEYLNQRAADHALPPGLIFNSYQWGDYLIWAGPRDLPVFVSSHVHFIPRPVWQQYFDIVNLELEYDLLLDSYGINMIVLSRSMHEQTIERLRTDGRWRIDYEDQRAVIFTRRRPL